MNLNIFYVIGIGDFDKVVSCFFFFQVGKKIMNIEYKFVFNAVYRYFCGLRDI